MALFETIVIGGTIRDNINKINLIKEQKLHKTFS